MWSQPEVVRHIGGRPFTEEEVWGRVLRYIGHWTALDFGYWAIRDKESGRFVGEAGFADFKREITPSLGGAPEIGWALMRGSGLRHSYQQTRAVQWYAGALRWTSTEKTGPSIWLTSIMSCRLPVNWRDSKSASVSTKSAPPKG